MLPARSGHKLATGMRARAADVEAAVDANREVDIVEVIDVARDNKNSLTKGCEALDALEGKGVRMTTLRLAKKRGAGVLIVAALVSASVEMLLANWQCRWCWRWCSERARIRMYRIAKKESSA